MTEPTDRFAYIITDAEPYVLYTLSDYPIGDSPVIKLDKAEHDDYLNVRTRWMFWQNRLRKAAEQGGDTE